MLTVPLPFSPASLTRNRRESEPEQEAKRIYIHGMSRFSMLVAHALRGHPNCPPITLNFYRASQREQFIGGGEQITLWRNKQRESRGGFDWELIREPHQRYDRVMSLADARELEVLKGEGMSSEKLQERAALAEQSYLALLEEEMTNKPPIKHLILTVKASKVAVTLLSLKKRLGPDSTVLFIQNGIGVVDEVNEKVFPDPKTRPKYMVGTTSHGVRPDDAATPFVAVHADWGTMSLGLAPKLLSSAPSPTLGPLELGPAHNPNTELDMIASSRHLLQILSSTPVLAAAPFSPIELLKLQLDKLAVNAVIEPLTALFDCRNGSLLNNYAITRTMRLLLVEISQVLTSLPELRGQPNIAMRFSPERLETQVVGIASRTRQNLSSMLVDVRNGSKTEVEFINGWIVRRGEQMGITTGFNYMIMQLILGKKQMVSLEMDSLLQFERGEEPHESEDT